MFGKEIKLNLLDFKNQYIKGIQRAEGQVQVGYQFGNKNEIKIKIHMKEGLTYFSIGQTIANGIMLPHLDLFGNNFSFLRQKTESGYKIYFINLSVRDLEFSPQLRMKKGKEIYLEKNSLINLSNCIFYLVREEERKEEEGNSESKVYL